MAAEQRPPVRLRVRTETVQEIEVTVAELAKYFCAMDDDQQARFFVEIAKIAEGWPSAQENQWYYVGSHLRTCECSTDAARDMIRAIAYGVEKGTHV